MAEKDVSHTREGMPIRQHGSFAEFWREHILRYIFNLTGFMTAAHSAKRWRFQTIRDMLQNAAGSAKNSSYAEIYSAFFLRHHGQKIA